MNTFNELQLWAPLLNKTVKANAPIALDIGVINLCQELDFGGLERIFGGNVQLNHKKSSFVRTFILLLVEKKPRERFERARDQKTLASRKRNGNKEKDTGPRSFTLHLWRLSSTIEA